jgi:hypothetical protein
VSAAFFALPQDSSGGRFASRASLRRALSLSSTAFLAATVQLGGVRPLIQQPAPQICAFCHQPTWDRPKLSSASCSTTEHRLHQIFVTGCAAHAHYPCPCWIFLAISRRWYFLDVMVPVVLECSSLISVTCFEPQKAFDRMVASRFYPLMHFHDLIRLLS